MSPELLQVLFWLLIATLGLVVYELREATKPPFCEHCAHCHAVREQERQRQAEPQTVRHDYTWRERDDDDRR